MKTPVICTMALLAATSVGLAQSFTYPLDPRATFLRINSDTAAPPLVIDLAALGVAPGQWLRISSTGAYSHISGGAETTRSVIAVFSASATLLPENLQQRVPDAIPAGPAIVSGSTYFGALPMDIGEDFQVGHADWDDHVEVEVPFVATHLFVGVHDSLYNDNRDTDGDFGVVVTPVKSPLLSGTGEHLELLTAVGPLEPDARPIVPTRAGELMTAQLHDHNGLLYGAIYLFLADVGVTGQPVPETLPRLWMQNLLIVQAGLIAGVPGWSDSWTMVAPAGYAGTTVFVQIGAITPLARNGLYVTTDAHRFELK